MYFVGRLSPLVDEVLPEARRRLAQSLPVVPEIRVASQVIVLSVARGTAYAGLALAPSPYGNRCWMPVARAKASMLTGPTPTFALDFRR